jgi:Fe2+ transport system protein FeoA
MNAIWRRFLQGGSAGEAKISKTDSRANSVEVQCEACPLNQVHVGVAVRVKKLCASHDIQARLRELGFCEQQIIRLLATQSNYICQVWNARLAISHRLAGFILVEPLRSPSKEVARIPLEAQWQ